MIDGVGGRLPDFLIVGAAKSGTTTLANQLAEHPDVHVMPDKEAHFFDRDERWSLGVDWYRERFSAHGGAKWVGEATPTYMASPVAAERMARLLPGARLIAVLREPVDRAYSHYWHWRVRLGRERREFADAVADELAATGPSDVPPGRPGAPEPAYIGAGHYLPQLLRLCERYPRESILVLLLEDVRDRAAATFAETCRFLGIDDSFVPSSLDEVANPHVEPRWEKAWLFMYQHRLWRRVPRPLLPGVVRLLTTPDASYPPMADDLRRRLEEHFAPANSALADWLGRDLPGWSGCERRTRATI